MGKKYREKAIIGDTVLLPHDRETEHIVLGTLMMYNEEYQKYSDLLGVELFYDKVEQRAYKCIEGVIKDGKIANIPSLLEYAERHEIQLVDDNGLMDDMKMKDNRCMFLDIFMNGNIRTLEQDIMRLRYMSKQRRMWLFLQQTSRDAIDPTVNIDDVLKKCETALTDLQDDIIRDDGVNSFKEYSDKMRDIVSDNAEGKKQCLVTGFRLFDEHYLIRPKALTVIAAFTSVGKSSLAMNIAVNVAKNGVGVAYYSLEMGGTELISRVIARDMGLPSSVILNDVLNEWQLQMFDRVIGQIKNLPIYIDERSTLSFDRTIRSIRSMVKTRNVRLAIIDYLQIYSQGVENQEQQLAMMVRTAKNVAVELDIPIIVLSQLSRGGAHPAINMMRGSGQIEETADNIVLIDRPEAYPDNKVTKYEGEFEDKTIKDTAKLILSKGRGVGTGCSLVGFQSKYTYFFDMDNLKQDNNNDSTGDDAPF